MNVELTVRKLNSLILDMSEDGVERRIRLKLTDEECDKLQHSIDVIKENINALENLE